MANRVDPNLVNELNKFGKGDWNACYHCGKCTVLCPLSERGFLFPRKGIRQLQMGIKEKIAGNIDPWLCYYCGDCSEKCRRDANPAELMMTFRRYLISVYDWTGFARKLYTSKIWEFGSILVLASVVLILFILFHGPMTTELTAEGGVKLNTFAPWKTIHFGDLIMVGLLSFFLITNLINMFMNVIVKDKKIKIPFYLYFTELWALIAHFISQSKFSKCARGKGYWIVHILTMVSYVTLFIMIVIYLKWFQTDNIYPWWHPQRSLGYFATFGLLAGVVYFVIGRLKKNREINKFSHITDWTFLILLFITAITGILVHIFRINGFPFLTYYLYVAHLMVLFPMLMIEVPFSKWSHLAYRPFAIYLANIKKAATKHQVVLTTKKINNGTIKNWGLYLLLRH